MLSNVMFVFFQFHVIGIHDKVVGLPGGCVEIGNAQQHHDLSTHTT
jgi:hypothetical protein